jgi:hypothetical protein
MEESEQPPAQFPEADGGGGRSGRGPATHVPGETEPGGVLPPYDGRTTGDEGESVGKDVEGLTSPEPTDTPGGRDASPADEHPATDDGDDEPSDPGVGPAHIPGTTRGEDLAPDDHEPDRPGEEGV